jgi:hypothetical protein
MAEATQDQGPDCGLTFPSQRELNQHEKERKGKSK